MSEVNAENGAVVAPVENVATATPAETAPEPTKEQGADVEKVEQPRDDKGRFEGYQNRINEITRARREAERRAEAVEQRARELEQRLQSLEGTQRQPAESLNPEQFTDYNEYVRAIAKQAADDARKAVEQQFRQQESQRSQQEMAEAFGRREAEYAKSHPDYADAVADLGRSVRYPQEVIEVIATSDHGPAVLHHLATHLDEADRLARMRPHLAALHLGRLEAQLTAPKPKPVSNAPAPAPRVNGGAAITKNPDDMTTEEWVAWRRAQLKAK
jgi:hypothetical protein